MLLLLKLRDAHFARQPMRWCPAKQSAERFERDCWPVHKSLEHHNCQLAKQRPKDPCSRHSHNAPVCKSIALESSYLQGGEGRPDMSSADTTGQYRRLTGVLRIVGHSPMLETVDERIVRLITSENLVSYDGVPVIVEGKLSGRDQFQLEWIDRPAP